jgi:hypothetical protein
MEFQFCHVIQCCVNIAEYSQVLRISYQCKYNRISSFASTIIELLQIAFDLNIE